jgi:hypothetical protein
MRTIAALFIDARGPYPKIPGIDPWDEARDALLYDGPHPVVSHPPCGAWSGLKHLSHGGGKDCGPVAVAQVRKWGGVLEQPETSKLWAYCGLPMPGDPPDAYGGFSILVEQVAWGHVARKRTLLYFVGIDPKFVESGIRTGGVPTHWVSGGRNQIRKNGKAGGGAVPPGIKVCSKQQRNRTPVAFAEWLVSLARSVER